MPSLELIVLTPQPTMLLFCFSGLQPTGVSEPYELDSQIIQEVVGVRPSSVEMGC